MNNVSDTYIIKINLNDNINNDINKIVKEAKKQIPNENIDDTDIIYMSKKEYNNYILSNSGTLVKTNLFDIDLEELTNQSDQYTVLLTDNCDKCTICHEYLKKKNNKLYRLNVCNHIFHYKCIKKWFNTVSNSIHHCPLCRYSNASIC